MSKKDEMVDSAPRRLCKYHPHLNGADFWGGDGSFQVFWQTDLEIDLEQTQNCCQMII